MDIRTVATARLVSQTWHMAVSGAPATIECSLPGNDCAAARAKLKCLRAVVPCMRDLRLSVSPGATSELLVETLKDLGTFHLLT
jgi:hypothetical protein